MIPVIGQMLVEAQTDLLILRSLSLQDTNLIINISPL
jgi:hypothetical protein